MRIRARILTGFLPLLVTCLLAGVWLVNAYVADLLQRDAVRQMESLASAGENRLRNVYRQQSERHALISSRSRLRVRLLEYLQGGSPDLAAELVTMLGDSLRVMDEFNGLALVAADGRVIATTGQEWFPPTFADKPWLAEAMQDFGIHEYAPDGEGFPGMVLAGPVVLGDETLGALVISATLESLTAATVDYTGLGATGETQLAIRNAEGDALFITPTRFDPGASLNRVVRKESVRSPIIRALAGHEGVNVDAIDYRGVPVFAVTRYLPEPGWGIVVKKDAEEVLMPLQGVRRGSLYVVAGVIPVALLLGILIAGGISQPMVALTEQARRIHAENVGAEVGAIGKGRNELETLGQVISDMTAALLQEKRQLEIRVEERTEELLTANEELQATTEHLAESEERFAAAVAGTSDGLWDWPDTEHPGMWFSPRFYELLKTSSEKMRPSIDGLGDVIHEECRARIMASLLRIGAQGGVMHEEFQVLLPDGSTRWFRMRGATTARGTQPGLRMAGSLQDIMEYKVAEAEIQQLLRERERQATHDPLTGLPNRRGFEERWSGEVSRAKREGLPLLLLVMDADHFKSVNDTWGHNIGDDVLQMLSRTIRAALRDSDIPARFGGEEFVIALPNTSVTAGEEVANRLREQIAQQQVENGDGGLLSVTCSMGLAQHGPDATLEQTLEAADQALYRAKESGRNRVELASAT